jgi:hypothetical protein
MKKALSTPTLVFGGKYANLYRVGTHDKHLKTDPKVKEAVSLRGFPSE